MFGFIKRMFAPKPVIINSAQKLAPQQSYNPRTAYAPRYRAAMAPIPVVPVYVDTSSDNLLTGMVLGEMMSRHDAPRQESSAPEPSHHHTPDPTPSYDSPSSSDSAASSDPSPSYDSGSSFDSGSSSDSGGSFSSD